MSGARITICQPHCRTVRHTFLAGAKRTPIIVLLMLDLSGSLSLQLLTTLNQTISCCVLIPQSAEQLQRAITVCKPTVNARCKKRLVRSRPNQCPPLSPAWVRLPCCCPVPKSLSTYGHLSMGKLVALHLDLKVLAKFQHTSRLDWVVLALL